MYKASEHYLLFIVTKLSKILEADEHPKNRKIWSILRRNILILGGNLGGVMYSS